MEGNVVLKAKFSTNFLHRDPVTFYGVASKYEKKNKVISHLAIIANILGELRKRGAVGRDPIADIVLNIKLMVRIFFVYYNCLRGGR